MADKSLITPITYLYQCKIFWLSQKIFLKKHFLKMLGEETSASCFPHWLCFFSLEPQAETTTNSKSFFKNYPFVSLCLVMPKTNQRYLKSVSVVTVSEYNIRSMCHTDHLGFSNHNAFAPVTLSSKACKLCSGLAFSHMVQKKAESGAKALKTKICPFWRLKKIFDESFCSKMVWMKLIYIAVRKCMSSQNLPEKPIF